MKKSDRNLEDVDKKGAVSGKEKQSQSPNEIGRNQKTALVNENVFSDSRLPPIDSKVGSIYRLSPQALRRLCSIDHFTFATTEELPTTHEIIGQPRGVRAIEFGIGIDSPGYNIFILGPSGTGRATAVLRFLEGYAKESNVPHDWVYVYNFKAPHKPHAIMLPRGIGFKLRDAMEELLADLRRQIPKTLSTEDLQQAITAHEQEFEKEREHVMEKVFNLAGERGLVILRTSKGLAVVPASDGKPIPPEVFAQLPEEARNTLEQKRLAVQQKLEEATRMIHTAEKEVAKARQELEAEAVSSVLDLHLTEIREICEVNHKALTWLDEVRQDILDRLYIFKANPYQDKESISTGPTGPIRMTSEGAANNLFRRYHVNLIVDHYASEGAPVVLEDLPTYKNIVGYIESEVLPGGAMSADFTLIKPGALHRANGGYLVVQAADILKQPFAWEALKRAISSNVIRIEDPESRSGVGVLFPQMPAPEPIPLSVKVVILGMPELYYQLQSTDEEFPELFKVKADFAATMKRNHENEHQYALFIAARCHEGHLPHFDVTGVAKIVEYGSWLARDQGMLSTRFGDISDLVYESAYCERRDGKELVSAADVQHALEERTFRSNLLEDEYRQRILEDTIFIDTEGQVVGQANGLTVLRSGDYIFGQPCRVTARIYLGNEGVVNIEREVEMAGPIHNKGLLTLRGYLGGQYAHEHPLSLTGSITFEQNYGGIEGDSASTTELYTLLSALSGYPLRQDIAVTGSVNQLGEVQPIGGATQKIEGFYEVCKARGLTGSQGVIIPSSSVRSLMLKEEVVEAVENNLFHIYSVESIDQGIEILTGVPAGTRGPDGTFPEGTVHHAVNSQLQDMAERMQYYESCRHEK